MSSANPPAPRRARVEPGKMTVADYPSLYAASDRASVAAQKGYMRLQMAYLASLICAGVVGAAGPAIEKDTIISGTIATVFLAAGVVLIWTLRARRLDKKWFDGRAVAESVKTATWRYMMNVPPYGRERAPGDADREILRQLEEIRGGRAMATGGAAAEITELMRKVRASSFEDRRDFYLSERLRNQKEWYARKGRQAGRSATSWFWTISTLQIVALPLAIYNLAVGHTFVDAAPVAAAMVGPFVAWTQIRRYDELNQTYSVAAQELSTIEAIVARITVETEFQHTVMQAEDASSREHTMWCARRETPASRSA